MGDTKDSSGKLKARRQNAVRVKKQNNNNNKKNLTHTMTEMLVFKHLT